MNNLSNFTLTFQIILINLVIIVISFVFFGLFNFYIISRDYSLEDKKMELANLSAELSDSLVYEAIRTPYFFPIDNKGTFSSDDEVGFFFKSIQGIQEILNDFQVKRLK